MSSTENDYTHKVDSHSFRKGSSFSKITRKEIDRWRKKEHSAIHIPSSPNSLLWPTYYVLNLKGHNIVLSISLVSFSTHI